MIANVKKSLKLMAYGYKFKTNMVFSAVALVISILMYISTFMGHANLLLMDYILLYLALSMPSQMREDLLHCQMVVSSGFRRFFDINFGDIYFFVSSILTYVIHGVLLLLFFEEGNFKGEVLTANLISAGFCIGAMTISFAIINKNFFAGVFMYFVLGVVHGFSRAMMNDFEKGGFLYLSNGSAFIIGFVLVVICCLLAMWLRRMVYKKPYCILSTTEELNKAMKQ